MKQFLLSIYQPDGDPPAADVLERVMRDVDAVRQQMQAAGAFVSAVGLRPAGEAKVVRVRAGKAHTTDGPFTEAKEHIGGFCVIRAKHVYAAAEWARLLAAATTLPIEVRESREEGAD